MVAAGIRAKAYDRYFYIKSNDISEQAPEIRFLEGAIGDFLQAPVAIRTQKKRAVYFTDVTTDDLVLAGITAAKNLLNLGAFH